MKKKTEREHLVSQRRIIAARLKFNSNLAKDSEFVNGVDIANIISELANELQQFNLKIDELDRKS